MSSILPPARIDLATHAAVPPRAKRIPTHATVHGTTRGDDYAWLRDRDDPAVTAYLEAENAYTAAVMAPTQELQRALYTEMLGHIKETDLSVPYRRGGYYYYARTEAGRQYPIYARKAGSLDAPEEITLDLNVLARDRAYFAIGAYEVNDDGTLLAYSTDTTGYRQYTLHVRDLRTGVDLPDELARVCDVAWASDGATLYVTTEDATSKRRDRFHRYALGAAAATTLYEERDERFDLAAVRSSDRAYVFLIAASKATTEIRALRVDAPGGELATVVPRADGHRVAVEHHGDRFFFVTNRDAVDFRLVSAPDADPQEARWTTLVPERPGIHLEDIAMFARHAVLVGRSGGFGNLEVLDLATGALRAVALDETVHSVFPAANPEFDADAFRFTYSSLVTPNRVYDLDLATGERTLLKATEVPGYDPAAYATDVQYAVARDGTRVPVSLVYRRDVVHDGEAPLLLYGYGSYGFSMDPTFSPARLVLLDRGVTYAIAHVRGGGELGERWRTSGHLQHKLNTFTDFIDVAEHLVARGYASPARLAIAGGSAGGLLVNAVANMRPDLFAAVLSQVPFVDVLNTMLDATLPLTTAEYLEWGDPRVRDEYAYMMRYSPYDNVRAQAYPAMLVRVSVNDSQVPYWEGAKLVAKLRTLKTDANPLLLETNFGAGHGGASGRYDSLRETAFNNAFILSQIARN